MDVAIQHKCDVCNYESYEENELSGNKRIMGERNQKTNEGTNIGLEPEKLYEPADEINYEFGKCNICGNNFLQEQCFNTHMQHEQELYLRNKMYNTRDEILICERTNFQSVMDDLIK